MGGEPHWERGCGHGEWDLDQPLRLADGSREKADARTGRNEAGVEDLVVGSYSEAFAVRWHSRGAQAIEDQCRSVVADKAMPEQSVDRWLGWFMPLDIGRCSVGRER